MIKHESIFKSIDNNIKDHREKKVALAIKKGYKYFSQYVLREYQDKTYKQLTIEIKEATGQEYQQGALYGIIKRTKEKIDDSNSVIFQEIKREGTCKKCNKRKIAPGNWSHCQICSDLNNKMSSVFVTESYGITNFTG